MRASKSKRRWAVAAVLALCLASGCSSSESSGGSGGANAVADTAARFAPEVNLASGERWLPLDGREFVDHSDLSWLGSCGPDRLAVGRSMTPPVSGFRYPVLTSARLGRERPWVLALRRLPDCLSDPDKSFKTTDYTHPFDARRADGLVFGEGYFLDLADNARGGRRPEGKVPAYYDVGREQFRGKPVLRITYWMLFGRDAPALPRAVRQQFTREGDWERVAVLLRPAGDNDFRPLAVRYYRGAGALREVEWRAAPRVSGEADGDATHPVVYSARGSHTLFPAAGRYPYITEFAGEGGRKRTATDVASACPDCIRWRTWRLLRNARAEPWYGYGGAWGDSGDYHNNAGPLGPSPYAHQAKHAARTGPNAPAP